MGVVWLIVFIVRVGLIGFGVFCDVCGDGVGDARDWFDQYVCEIDGVTQQIVGHVVVVFVEVELS